MSVISHITVVLQLKCNLHFKFGADEKIVHIQKVSHLHKNMRFSDITVALSVYHVTDYTLDAQYMKNLMTANVYWFLGKYEVSGVLRIKMKSEAIFSVKKEAT